MKKNITVVGSGLVGSLAAIYMAKRGHQVNLFERRPDMRKNVISAGRSINLALSDRGFRGLAGAGLQDEIKQISIPMYGRCIHLVDGTTTYQPYGKEGQAIYSVSRSGINMKLMDLAESMDNINIRFNHRCLDIDIRKVTTTFIDDTTKETLVDQADLVLGADGAFSPVRLSLMTKTDRFNYSQSYLEQGYKELVIPAGEDGSFQMEKNALHIWPRKSFMLIALPNLDGSFTCTLFLALAGEVAFNQLTDDASVTKFFQEYFPDAMALMPTLLTDFATNATSSLVTVRCYPWVFEDKLALIGDSAHAIVPFFGQGMNSGFEDCAVLDEIIEKEGDNWKAVFEAYQQSRKPNGDAVAQLALDNFIEMRDKTGDPKFLLRKKIESRIADENPTFLSMYAQVTFSPHISYDTAYKAGLKHGVYLDQLANIENVFDKWETPEVQNLVQALLLV